MILCRWERSHEERKCQDAEEEGGEVPGSWPWAGGKAGTSGKLALAGRGVGGAGSSQGHRCGWVRLRCREPVGIFFLCERVRVRPATECDEGERDGGCGGRCKVVARREEGLDGRREAVGPAALHEGPPAACSQEFKESVSVVEFIPSSAAQLYGCRRGVGGELGGGGWGWYHQTREGPGKEGVCEGVMIMAELDEQGGGSRTGGRRQETD